MKTTIEVAVGRGTLHSLQEIARTEGIDASTLVEQAITVWSYLRGPDERKRAGGAAIAIVVEREKAKMGVRA